MIRSRKTDTPDPTRHPCESRNPDIREGLPSPNVDMTSENAANGTTRRIALVVAYEGTDYAGFQSQVGAPTVQDELETAISKLTGVLSRVRGASRTDAGTHACGQVVDFATESALDASVFVPAMNYYLPEAIRVKSAFDAPAKFHSRYDATRREYRYSILNREVASPLLRRTHHLETAPLELANMQKAAVSLLGIRDFRRVSATYPADYSTVRKVLRWEADRHPSIPDVITIDCVASGFLRHQIRRANAVLVEIGKGKLPIHAMAEALAGRISNQLRIRTLPAKGLCLKSVHYPGYDHLFDPKVEDKHETH